ncbi:hypothetical protein QR98_0045890 [Sarcoptes scabiei]|uniref:Uncharacterized protein n=1 Tax=Sarcoptes scabiei TaxID=52283 RepID=A0A132A568_SARSC|nr:hypothetical protein QR98_0045890 [Sarcoptes scabiei]
MSEFRPYSCQDRRLDDLTVAGVTLLFGELVETTPPVVATATETFVTVPGLAEATPLAGVAPTEATGFKSVVVGVALDAFTTGINVGACPDNPVAYSNIFDCIHRNKN